MVADTNGMGPELVKALIAAKKEFKTLVRNKVNPFFKSKYADLAALHEVVDGPLAKHGLTVLQPTGIDEQRNHFIKTMIAHESGQSISGVYPLPGGVKPQELASAITYARRVSLAALLGVPADDDDGSGESDEDDDGEGTEGRAGGKPKPPAKEEKPTKKEEPKKPDTKNVAWRGTIAAVEEIKPKVWKVTGGDTTTFATSVPEHKAIAETAGKSLCMVEIAYQLNGVGSKLIQTIKEIKQ
jgi:hypothetical protein